MAKKEAETKVIEENTKGKEEEQGVTVSSDETVETVAKTNAEAETEKNEDTGEDTTEAPKRRRGRPRKEDSERPSFNELSEDEQIRIKAQRNTYSLSKADKKTREKQYEREYIITEFGDMDFEDDNTVKREEWLELGAARNGKILKGRIVSITTVDTNHEPDDEDYIPQYMARVQYGASNFDIRIPSYLVYDFNSSLLYTKEGAREIFKNLSARIGSEIKFVVRHMDEKTGTVIADRLGAMSMEGMSNYFSRDGQIPRIMPGYTNRDIVKARIVANARDYITVDALGAEFNIMNDELSYFFIGDVRECDGRDGISDNFQVGSYVNVRILSVKYDKVQKYNSTYNLVRATGSVKRAKADPRAKHYDTFKVGDTWSGTVTGFDMDGIYVNLGGLMECKCKPDRYRENPVIGDIVRVTITLKDDEKKFVFGQIRY